MFVGREDDLAQLSGLWEKRVASLVTCRGRRRVGKSTLIEEFAKRTAEHFIVIEGLAPRKGMNDEKQRRNFCRRLAEQTGCEPRDAASCVRRRRRRGRASPRAAHGSSRF